MIKNNGAGKARIETLEGIRGLAILLVLFHHTLVLFTGLNVKNQFEHQILLWGYGAAAGVDLFFILSGFLITRLLLKAKGFKNYFKNFYIRRTLRIFPLYYLYLCFAFFVLPAFPKFFYPPFMDLSDSGWYWAYLSNFRMFFDKTIPTYYLSHTWSLAIEEQFYLFWPFIIAVFPVKTLKKVLPLIIILSALVRFYIEGTGATAWQTRIFTFGRLDILALGGFLAILYEEKFFDPAKSMKIKMTAAAACFFLMSALSYVPNVYTGLKESFFALKASVFFTALMLFALASSEKSITHKILSFKLFTLFGKYSYSIYLFHMAVGLAIYRFMVSGLVTLLQSAPLIWTAVFLLVSGISFGTALVTYHLFEFHFLKLKNKLAPTPC